MPSRNTFVANFTVEAYTLVANNASLCSPAFLISARIMCPKQCKNNDAPHGHLFIFQKAAPILVKIFGRKGVKFTKSIYVSLWTGEAKDSNTIAIVHKFTKNCLCRAHHISLVLHYLFKVYGPLHFTSPSWPESHRTVTF